MKTVLAIVLLAFATPIFARSILQQLPNIETGCRPPKCTAEQRISLWPSIDPRDFYQCIPLNASDWAPLVRTCPEGLLFNAKQEACDFPERWENVCNEEPSTRPPITPTAPSRSTWIPTRPGNATLPPDAPSRPANGTIPPNFTLPSNFPSRDYTTKTSRVSTTVTTMKEPKPTRSWTFPWERSSTVKTTKTTTTKTTKPPKTTRSWTFPWEQSSTVKTTKTTTTKTTKPPKTTRSWTFPWERSTSAQ